MSKSITFLIIFVFLSSVACRLASNPAAAPAATENTTASNSATLATAQTAQPHSTAASPTSSTGGSAATPSPTNPDDPGANSVLCEPASFAPAAYTPTKRKGIILYKNIPYNLNPTNNPALNSLDVYTPQNPDNLPVLIYVHGGGWKTGDKGNKMETKPPFFTSQNSIFISINYRLAPDVSFPVYPQDVACAVAWIYRNISILGGNPDQLALMGHSAGAHLVSLISTDEAYLNAYSLDLSILRGTISLDTGAFDIPSLITIVGAGYQKMLINAFSNNPQIWEQASPINHVAPSKGVPSFLLIYAGDREASKQGTKEMAEALAKAGVHSQRYHAVDKNHASLNDDIGKPQDETIAVILSFLAQIWKP